MTWFTESDAEKAARALDPEAWAILDSDSIGMVTRRKVSIEQACAALSAVNPYEWREISDDAKAGHKEILAYSKTGGTGVMLIQWTSLDGLLTESEIEAFYRAGMTEDEINKDDWFYADMTCPDRLSPDCYPTHWMPLPQEGK